MAPLLSHSPPASCWTYTRNRRRIGERGPLRQPLAHARSADAAGDNSDRHLEALRDRIAKGRHEAAAAAAGAGLRVVGRLPPRAVEGGHQAGLRALPSPRRSWPSSIVRRRRTLRPRRRAAPRPSPRPFLLSLARARQAYQPPGGTLSSARKLPSSFLNSTGCQSPLNAALRACRFRWALGRRRGPGLLWAIRRWKT